MRKHFLVYILITVLAVSSICLPWSMSIAYADDGYGDGNGDGSGGGEGVALTLVSSEPSDGSADVARDATFQLTFNKNVCNLIVLDNNRDCFHLTDSDGSVIPITVIFPDDQVQRTYRREIFVRANEPLAADTSYHLAIDNTLMAKNGTSIDNAHVVSFTTGSSTGAAEPEALQILGDLGVQTFHTALPETEASVPQDNSALIDSENSGLSVRTIALIAITAIVVILILIVAVILVRRHRGTYIGH